MFHIITVIIHAPRRRALIIDIALRCHAAMPPILRLMPLLITLHYALRCRHVDIHMFADY